MSPRTVLAAAAGLLALGAAGWAGWQAAQARADEREMRAAWQRLSQVRLPLPERFDPAMLDGLPEPARRYLGHVIRPGARLSAVVEIDMGGELSLGNAQAPGYRPMQAQQILAAPEGLVWRVRAGGPWLSMAGSDGMAGSQSWTRFRLWGWLPLVRAGDDADHLRSSFGRVVAEAAFWAPAFLLPREGVHWQALDADTARATVRHAGWVQAVDVHVGPDGQPRWVRLPRWSNANPQGVWQEQPFGGELSDFREVDGYRLPFHVDGGNFFGTPAYFPFYRARVLAIRIR